MDTLPAPLAALLLIGFGASLLWVANRARHTGELPAGSKGFRAYRPRRDESPAAFYFFQALYVVFGAWLVVYGIGIATGQFASIPLR